jgi:hypothetical protein
MNMLGYPNAAVLVTQERYDELLHKESTLDAIVKLHGKMSDYVFRDAVGYLFGAEKVKADEEA